MKVEIRESNDGSSTLYNVALDETYHSVHGAIQEAKHVFISSGLNHALQKKACLSILEIGFGTGLNALLTYQKVSELEDTQVDYIGIEKYPLEEGIWSKVNYPDILGDLVAFQEMHVIPWHEKIEISNNFSIHKIQTELEDFKMEDRFDLIYFDAFSPTSQPELWNTQIFQNMFDSLKKSGVFVTYCAKGQVRRDLQSVGFIMERIPGPPGKREMLRGTKK